MKPFRQCAAVLVFGAVWASVGCATVVTRGGADQEVTIASDPPGGALTIDGRPSGATPLCLPLPRKSEHQVEIAAPGYETAHLTVRRTLNPWLIGNIIFGGIPGLIVDVISDATHKLSPDELTVTLKALETAPTTSPMVVEEVN